MDSKPLVSICITSFNRLEDLKETIRRTQDITYDNKEIIVVDGGSTDGSVEFLKTLDRGKFKTVFIDVDKGIGYTRLIALRTGAGEFVVSIDDDAFLRPDVVEKTVNIFLANPKLGAIGYGFVNPNIDFSEEKYLKKTNDIYGNEDKISGYDSIIALCGCSFRKIALSGFGQLDLNWIDFSKFNKSVGAKRLMTTEIEADLCFHLFTNGYYTVNIPELVAYHKSSPSNRNINSRTAIQIKAYFSMIIKYYPYKKAIWMLMRLIYYCLYYSILQKNAIYIKALIYSLQYISQNIFYYKRLDCFTYKLMKHRPIQTIFSRNQKSIYVGARFQEVY